METGEKMKKRKKVIKGIISYILTLCMTVFFALYLNATVGWFMFVALILAPVLSVFFAFLSAWFVKADCEMENCILAKGDTCQMIITVQNKSLFPTTPLEIEILNGDGVKTDNKSILISLLPFEKKSFYVNFAAKICGPSVVGVRKVKATDYLGIASFRVRKIPYEQLKRKVSVIPNMADVSLRDDKILKVMQASLHAEDGDDTVEVSSNTFGGFPGCDNREYVPGDPLKRVNWKQSAKRGKLLVRLDDVLASKSVNLVLDSVFWKKMVDIEKLKAASEYTEIPEEDIPAKVAEDAVETALGIARSLVLNTYSVNFFIAKENTYEKYALEDEKDIENLRLMLAEYEFDREGQKERFPKDELLDRYTSYIFCTPNDYKEVFFALDEGEDAGRMSVFSVVGDLYGKNNSTDKVFHLKPQKKAVKEKEKITKIIAEMLIPYLLALLSGVTVFAVFKVSPFSVWTLVQAIVCIGVFALCKYAKEHKIIGGALISIVIVAALFYFGRVAFSGIRYMQWFMSGADTIENTVPYLMTIVVIFTMLFAMVLFYYTQVYYRTSAILVVTILPYIIYVKLIREVGIGYVMLAIILNVAAFLINTRKQRDKGKRIIGYHSGLVSVLLYALCFVMLAMAIPKSETTKYYHFFEEWFLGGNTSVPIPEEYGDQNDYSGNADNFNQLTNRQLYNINDADMSERLYLRRQVFDYYDFENDRWYFDKQYSTYQEDSTTLADNNKNLRNSALLEAFFVTEEISPGFLAKYGLDDIDKAAFVENKYIAHISARNFESYYLVTPTRTLEVYLSNDRTAYLNRHGIYGRDKMPFGRYVTYSVNYISQFESRDNWIKMGGSDMDYATANEMLHEMTGILSENEKYKELAVARAFYEESKFAAEYAAACMENTEEISKEVKDLALEITKDCTYEWEKAEALEDYFHEGEFTYDLEYDAPDDSVEYFLFKSKTGTCSDFASAYVLMARAAGLTVRYVEGFVPTGEVSATYEWQYVVRTKNSHAYPEVYIPNFGFVVYEPTVGSIGGMNIPENAGLMSYITTVVIRVVAVFAIITLLIALILLCSRIIIPSVKEKSFLSRVAKAENGTAVLMIYRRVLDKYSLPYISNASWKTPYEFAKEFEAIFALDISSFIYLVEKIAYRNTVVDESEKMLAMETYRNIKTAVKEKKKK